MPEQLDRLAVVGVGHRQAHQPVPRRHRAGLSAAADPLARLGLELRGVPEQLLRAPEYRVGVVTHGQSASASA
jgi:hypothetical protein